MIEQADSVVPGMLRNLLQHTILHFNVNRATNFHKLQLSVQLQFFDTAVLLL